MFFLDRDRFTYWRYLLYLCSSWLPYSKKFRVVPGELIGVIQIAAFRMFANQDQLRARVWRFVIVLPTYLQLAYIATTNNA